jgi:LysR family transcriptional regulator, low CO2-responsive transcriptional regulator
MTEAQSHSETQLPHLETFAIAAELNSFTAAAQALGLTQAAVSQRIHALEQSLGTALFDRKAGRILLTAAGQGLYIYAQQILALHRAAREEITGRKAPIVGDLLLAASSIPGEHLLPSLVSVYARQYPGIRVRATVLDSRAVLDQIEQGKVHLGLVGRKCDAAHLEFQAFAEDEMLLVVPPEHRWKRLKRISFKQLTELPLILREPGSGSRWCLEQALSAAGKSLNDLQTGLELGSNESIKAAVAQGLGGAILSHLAVRKELEAGHLHALRIEGLKLERTMYVVWDRRRALPAPARMFLQFLNAQRTGGD